MSNRLGKGLEALFKENVQFSEEVQENETVVELELSLLKKNPFQPRRAFDDEKINELAQSIREHGVLQPIIVTKIKDGQGYYIVAGERRYRACQKLGLITIPAIVRDIDYRLMAEIALLENLQREDLNIIEEASAYKLLIEQYELTQQELADRIGKSRAHIANTLRILNLPDAVKTMLIDGDIEFGHAKILVGLNDPIMIIELAKRIKEDNLSVRALEELVNEITKEKTKKHVKKVKRDPNIEFLEEQLCKVFGTKIQVITKDKGGKLIIDYHDAEDFNRILRLMHLEDIVNIID
ncbi:MAG: ParB/RepB/Spo0J family partition protein [Bacilli bacterium]|nr:ParB/RepB/Spo0J family partition protein [Bacilli bacterium]